MRAVTVRRFLVFGVCAFGVGCLYLVPSVAKSPDQVSSRQSHDQQTSQPSTDLQPAPVQSTGQAVPGDDETGARTQERSAKAAKPTGDPSESNTDSQDDSGSGRNAAAHDDTTSSRDTTAAEDEGRSNSSEESNQRRKPNRGGATAFDPRDKRDETPPDPVRGIRFGPITPDDLTVRWSASNDDQAVVGYQIWLDGFRVATTTDTRVTVNWFNDDMGQHVIQVKAVDAAGNQSRTAEIVLVDRPSPQPSETPSSQTNPSATARVNDVSEPTESLPTGDRRR